MGKSFCFFFQKEALAFSIAVEKTHRAVVRHS
jgi:hypothetical protein